MSGNIAFNVEEEMEPDLDELWFMTECVFCKKNLTSKAELNLSKLLQCLHSSCQQCYDTWVDHEEKICPVCNLSTIKEEIRENKVLSEIVSDINFPDVEGIVCNIHDAAVSHWCSNCAEYICEECVKSHGQLKSTRDHEIKTKEEHFSGITIGEPKQVFPCPLHPQNQLTIVCHTCHAMTCRDCQLENHRDHKYDFVSDRIEDTKTEVYNFFKKIEYHAIVLSSAIDKITEREQKLEDLKLKLISQIKEMFDKIMDLVRMRCRELMVSAVSKTNEKLVECDMNRNELEKDLTSLKICLTFVKTVLYKSSDPVIFYTKELMMSHMERIRTSSRIPNAMDIINLRFEPENLDNLTSGICNFGCLDETPDTTDIDKTPYWKNVFATMMNTYADQLGLNTGIQQPHQQQMWQQILQFYNTTLGRKPVSENFEPQLHQLLAQQTKNAQLQKHLVQVKQQPPSPPEVAQQQQQQQIQQQQQQLQLQQAQLQQKQQLQQQQQIQQQIQQQLHQQQQSMQQHQMKLHQQLIQQQQAAHHQQQHLWHQRPQQFRHEQISPQPNHHGNKTVLQTIPSSVSPVSQNSPLHNNPQVTLLSATTAKPLSPQQQQNRVGVVSQQQRILNSCQQAVRPTSALLQSHHQQSFQQRLSQGNTHQQVVIANGMPQRNTPQGSISPQQHLQMATHARVQQQQLNTNEHMLRTYSNIRHQQPQQLASPPALHSPPLRSQLPPSVSIHRTGIGNRTSHQMRQPDVRMQQDGIPSLHQDRVSHERLPPPYSDQAYKQPPPYSFQVPLNQGCSTQVALVELKTLPATPSRNVVSSAHTRNVVIPSNNVTKSSNCLENPSHQNLRKLWHIPETVPIQPKPTDPPPTPHVDNIKKVKITQPPENIDAQQRKKPSPSPTHHPVQPVAANKSSLPDSVKKSTEVIPTTVPICKEEPIPVPGDFHDVLSTLNELNRSLDKVDITNERVPTEDREDSHEDWCAVCMDGGELVCCDVCPKAFHHSCHVPACTEEEVKGDWQCQLCKPVEPVVRGDGTTNSLSLSEKTAASRLLLEIYCQYDASLHLRQPVSPQNTQYYEIVREPLCLDQIRSKLALGRYKSIVEFVSDIKLMFNNYYEYNTAVGQADSPAMVQIKSLEEVFNSLLSRFLADPVMNNIASIKTEAIEN